MATVDKDSANWRLFGGGGLLVGGLVWLIGEILKFAALSGVGSWLEAIGVIVVGVAFFFVAFGQTGSNGAVGASLIGKVSLVVAGVGWALLGLVWLLAAAGVLLPIAGVLVSIGVVLAVVGGIASAVAVYQRGVARGAARWILFAPALWSVFYALVSFGWVPGALWVITVQAALFAITGVLYLLNRKDIG